MKKLIFTLFSLPLFLNAQVTLFEYDFDNLNAGNPLVQESGGPFETWSGGSGTSEDPILSTETVSSSPNSVNVFASSGTFHDFVIPFPNNLSFPSESFSGAYEFKMKMYIPQNTGAYINLGGPWLGAAQYTYGMGVFFNADGMARLESNENAQFTYPQNQWFELSFIYDLTGTILLTGFDDTRLTIDGIVKASQFTTNLMQSNYTIGVVDIAASAYTDNTLNSIANSNFFIDDIELIDLLGSLSLEDYNPKRIDVFPNPSSGKFAIDFNDSFDNAAMTITNMLGSVVYSEALSSVSNSTQNFDLDLNSGVYLVKVADDANEFTTRVVIK